jgi:hypothetical protein
MSRPTRFPYPAQTTCWRISSSSEISLAQSSAAAREKREADRTRRWQAQESLNAEIRSVNGELMRVLGSLDARLALIVPLPPAEAAE